MGINIDGLDVNTPMIHDRHLVVPVLEYMKENNIHYKEFKKPENLTILTTIGSTPSKGSDVNEGIMQERMISSLEGYGKNTVFEQSLEHIGIDNYVVLRKELKNYGDYKCTFKITWVLDYLESGKCDTDLLLCTDAIDVVFQDDPQKIVDTFNSFDCDLLFMSTKDNSAYNFMPDVQKFVNSTHPNRYLNAGVWIGKVDFVKEFLTTAKEFVLGEDDVSMDDYADWLKKPQPNYPNGGYDQDIFRFLEPKFYPRLKVDYQNLMAYRG